jgi:hypothetical protein
MKCLCAAREAGSGFASRAARGASRNVNLELAVEMATKERKARKKNRRGRLTEGLPAFPGRCHGIPTQFSLCSVRSLWLSTAGDFEIGSTKSRKETVKTARTV